MISGSIVGFGALDQGAFHDGNQFGGVFEAVITPAHALEIDDNIHLPLVPLQGLVVVVRDERWSEKPQPHFHAQIHQGIARSLIEVNHIGVIFGDGVIHPPHELVGEGREQRILVVVNRPVKVHRIHAFPPFSFSVAGSFAAHRRARLSLAPSCRWCNAPA